MIKALDDHRYAIDFAAVKRPKAPLLEALFGGPKEVIVDAYAVGQVLRAALRQCKNYDVEGRLQVWNEFRLFLCRREYEALRKMAPALQKQIGPALEDEVLRLKATYIGTPVLKLHVDEANEVEPGQGVLCVDWSADQVAGGATVAGEVTVRLDKVAQAPPTGLGGSKTQRAGSAILRHPQGTVPLAAGVTYIVGRGAPNAGPEHVAIPGASSRISRRQLSLQIDENKPMSATITREPGDSNPVSVNGQTLAPGEGLKVPLPAQLVLSGELTLEVVAC